MKLQYEGQEVERITEGYWPEGVTLIRSDDGSDFEQFENVVCLRTREDGYGVALTKAGHSSAHWRYWAIKPTKPAPRRLTNREAAELVTGKRFSVLDGEWVYHYTTYKAGYENEQAPKGIKLRAPGSDEWLEPTSDLLEVGGC